jgi:Transposase DDE domain
VQVVQFLLELLLAPDIKVIEPGLPETRRTPDALCKCEAELPCHGLLVPMVDKVQRECDEQPRQVSADSGFFSLHNLEVMEERGIDAYVPDSNMAGVLHHGGVLQQPTHHPVLLRMRSKLASPPGRALYRRRKALAEPVIGILKEQRGVRRFRCVD